jgi:enoyl-CoA hydratase/carnithine racemase
VTGVQTCALPIWLRHNDDVRAVVLSAAGDKAFCTGIDRDEAMAGEAGGSLVGWPSPLMFDDPGRFLCPKQCGLWKPVVAAVNGLACGGAFYLLGECDVLLAAEHATFFDPHVTYGMATAFEPLHMLHKMPFGEILRMSLLGNHERLSARRALEIGLVSEVVPADQLEERAGWVAGRIASAPPAAVQATLRAVWSGLEQARQAALNAAFAYVGLGNDPESLRRGQELFTSGQRMEWSLR